MRTTDVTSVTEHRKQPRKHLNRTKKTGRPLFLTTNWQAKAVALSPRVFDELADRSDLAGTRWQIARSDAQLKADRGMDARDALRGLAGKHVLRVEQ